MSWRTPEKKLPTSLPGAMGSRWRSRSMGWRLRARKSSARSSSRGGGVGGVSRLAGGEEVLVAVVEVLSESVGDFRFACGREIQRSKSAENFGFPVRHFGLPYMLMYSARHRVKSFLPREPKSCTPPSTRRAKKAFETQAKAAPLGSVGAARKNDARKTPARCRRYRPWRMGLRDSPSSMTRCDSSRTLTRNPRTKQSGSFGLGDAIDAGDEFAPVAKLGRENAAAASREPIITAAALAAPFDPAALNPAAAFESIKQRVERSHVKTDGAGRALLDEFADFVAVARTCFDQRENQKFGAALLPFELGGCGVHIWR